MKPISLYIAASWPRKHEMSLRGQELTEMGFNVLSDWYDGPEIPDFDMPEPKSSAVELAASGDALKDIEQVADSEYVVWFTGHGSGGKDFEAGYAYANGKQIVMIGPRITVFHFMPAMKWFPDWESAREWFQYRLSTKKWEEMLLPPNPVIDFIQQNRVY